MCFAGYQRNRLLHSDFQGFYIHGYEIWLSVLKTKSQLRVVQIARFVGIVVVLGSSRPCSETFPPKLMEKCPSRLAFSTASIEQSIFIIGQGGAEKLLGNGDALFSGICREGSSWTEAYPVRLQTPYISEESIYEHLSRH